MFRFIVLVLFLAACVQNSRGMIKVKNKSPDMRGGRSASFSGGLVSVVEGAAAQHSEDVQSSFEESGKKGLIIQNQHRHLVGLGGNCSVSSACTDANQVCSSSDICMCESGYYESSGSCSIVPAGSVGNHV